MSLVICKNEYSGAGSERFVEMSSRLDIPSEGPRPRQVYAGLQVEIADPSPQRVEGVRLARPSEMVTPIMVLVNLGSDNDDDRDTRDGEYTPSEKIKACQRSSTPYPAKDSAGTANSSQDLPMKTPKLALKLSIS